MSSEPSSQGPFEEELAPNYQARQYLPVDEGQILDKRYRAIAKLGFGTGSTVWLAENTKRWFWQRRFVAIKVLRSDHSDEHPGSEMAILHTLSRSSHRHEGREYIRLALDSFDVQGPHGRHACLVFEPMRETISWFQKRMTNERVGFKLLTVYLRMLLLGLDYMHRECRIIHTDLQPSNIMIELENDKPVYAMIELMKTLPTPRTSRGDRNIYVHRNFDILQGTPIRLKIADFGVAIRGPGPYGHLIQPNLLRAPEVMLDAGWSYSADIWNLGTIVWELLENTRLFHAEDPQTGYYDTHLHLQEMVALLGPPPKELLRRGHSTDQYFTAEGTLIPKSPPSRPPKTLEDTITVIDGDEKKDFIRFIKRLLVWLPEDRATAEELLTDPLMESVKSSV